MKLLRFALWNVGVRVCDHIGRPIDTVILRLPDRLQEQLGACLVLHPDWLLGKWDIPDAWWARFGWQ